MYLDNYSSVLVPANGASRPVEETSFEKALSQIEHQEGSLAQQKYEVLEKAFKSNNPNIIMKANTYWSDVQQRVDSGIKTRLIDPNEWTRGAGYKTKPFQLDYSTLRRMVSTTPIIKAIVTTRQSQVTAFSIPQRSKFETGFVVRKKREYYTEEEPKLSSQDKQRIQELTTFILNGGRGDNAWHGDTFEMFLSKITADALTLDQATFEVVRDRIGNPIEYIAVDGGTIRKADTYNNEDNREIGKYDFQGKERVPVKGYLPSHVQVIDGVIHAEYYPWELCFGVRNTTTDIRSNGYGKSEIEELVSIITWMLYGDTYNGKFFSQGSHPKGLLKVGKNTNNNRLAEFRNQWLAMVSGARGYHKIPVMEGDIEWIDMQKGNRDMEFTAWQEYLIKIACAVFKIAPEEIGFNLDKKGGLGNDSNEVKLQYSRDKGLKPLLKSIEFWINKWILQPLDDGFEFKFVGLDTDTEERELKLLNDKVTHGMGMKEWRRAQGLPDELEEGDFPLNSVYAQIMQQQMYSEEVEDNTELVDADMEEDLWATIGLPQITKGIINAPEMMGYRDNPMMADALKLLLN